jgi:hypothetical protein
MPDHRSIAIDQEATLGRLDRALGHLFAERGLTYTATPTYHKDASLLGLTQLKHVTASVEQLVGYDALNKAQFETVDALDGDTGTSEDAPDKPANDTPPEGEEAATDRPSDAESAEDADASGHQRTMRESMEAVETIKSRSGKNR